MPVKDYIPEYYRSRDVLSTAIGCGELTIHHLNKTCEAFEFIGISLDDLLIVRRANRIKEGQLGIWAVKGKPDELGFHYENFDDITIHAEADNQIRYRKKDIKVIGIVVGIIKAVPNYEFAEVTDAKK